MAGAVLALAVVGALGPAAYADTHGGHGGDGSGDQLTLHGHQPAAPHTTRHPHPTDDTKGHHDGENGDSSSGQVSLADLPPTPAPVTAYEMPFPCGETWTGSSRPGHTPSPRAVDWNRTDDFGSPVVAAASGVVTTAVTGMHKPSYGQYVVIDHGNGESTLYGHLNSVLVTVGQPIDQGTQLGTLGTTGNSTGPHLHFEERLDGAVVDAWFHGAKFPINTSLTSQNCGAVAPTVLPLAGNMVGGPQAEVVLFQLDTPARFRVTRIGKAEKVITMGAATDQPVLGDWDGDGRVNPGTRTPSTRQFTLRVKGKDPVIRFGKPADTPIAGNWDGTGAWEVGVRKAGTNVFRLRADDGTVTNVKLGEPDDRPVTGDWNGDGVTDLGVYDSTTAMFTLEWTDAAGVNWSTQVPFGQPGDLPIAGDWDGNGITDLGTWNPQTLVFSERAAERPSAVRARTHKVVFRTRH